VFGIGSTIYAIGCPIYIKKYSDPTELAKAELDLVKGRMIDGFINIVQSNKKQKPPFSHADLERIDKEFAALLEESQKGGGETLQPRLERLKEQKLDMYFGIIDAAYRTQERQHPTVIAAVFFCYISGIVLLAIPSIGTLCKVVRSTLGLS
jgi:hypothetical protein